MTSEDDVARLESLIVIDIDFKDFDYLVFEPTNFYVRNQTFFFAKEKVDRPEKSYFFKPYYFVFTYNQFFPEKLKYEERDILKELVRLKDKEIYFEDSFLFKDYLRMSNREKRHSEKRKELHQLHEKLK